MSEVSVVITPRGRPDMTAVESVNVERTQVSGDAIDLSIVKRWLPADTHFYNPVQQSVAVTIDGVDFGDFTFRKMAFHKSPADVWYATLSFRREADYADVRSRLFGTDGILIPDDMLLAEIINRTNTAAYKVRSPVINTVTYHYVNIANNSLYAAFETITNATLPQFLPLNRYPTEAFRPWIQEAVEDSANSSAVLGILEDWRIGVTRGGTPAGAATARSLENPVDAVDYYTGIMYSRESLNLNITDYNPPGSYMLRDVRVSADTAQQQIPESRVVLNTVAGTPPTVPVAQVGPILEGDQESTLRRAVAREHLIRSSLRDTAVSASVRLKGITQGGSAAKLMSLAPLDILQVVSNTSLVGTVTSPTTHSLMISTVSHTIDRISTAGGFLLTSVSGYIRPHA